MILEESEYVHGLLALNVERNQSVSRSEIAVHKPVPAPWNFEITVFAGLMVYHFLANLVETSILGQIGDIAVHLTIDLHNFTTSLR